MRIITVKNYENMSMLAANIVSAQVISSSNSVLGLATGDTPIGLYKQLIDWHQNSALDFSNIRTVNLDEYIGLSEKHRQSYAWFMNNIFFSNVNINPDNTFLPDGLAVDIEAECERYERMISTLGGIDLQILGLGHNGHIGFNEPDTYFKKSTHYTVLSESTLSANQRFFSNRDEMPKSVISMGIGTIMHAKRILLLCSGEGKSEILFKSLYGNIDPRIPASILQLHPDLTVVADEEASRLINTKG